MISILIPARNEFLLQKTIEATLAASEGEIEIIAVLDGCWDKPKIKDDPRITLIHYDESWGQRRAINEAAKIAKGKYILKTDAHSTFDKGFDVKLVKDCEYDWTVIPRMYNLHAFDWVCENGHRYYQDKADPHKENKCPECKSRLKIEYIWKIRKHKRTDFMHMDRDLRVQYWGEYRKRPEAKGKIVDVMNGQGACWFQHKDRFFELGGLDEKHGSWGQVGCEVACKAWLSGGRLVVNKKTWFAHVFRTTGEYSFPYHMRGSQQEKARKYSRDLWLSNKWPMQKRKFEWLIDKFAPVPGWEKSVVGQTMCRCDEMEVAEVWDDRMDYCEPRKRRAFLERYTEDHPDMDEKMKLKASPEKSIERFFDAFRPFVRMVLDDKDYEIKNTDYYWYLVGHLNPHDLTPELTDKGKRHVAKKVEDSVKLIKSIQTEGMKEPLDMWREGKRLRLVRGFRRLVILKEIGEYKMEVRIWKDEESFFKNQMKIKADPTHIPKKWRMKFAG